jgi:hypothetical protein
LKYALKYFDNPFHEVSVQSHWIIFYLWQK